MLEGNPILIFTSMNDIKSPKLIAIKDLQQRENERTPKVFN
jgi:hypothetical protein